MSDKINNGGPAFPQIDNLSLRDWFAGQVIASVRGWHPADRYGKSSAEIAYLIADEMIAARKGGAQ